MPQSLVAQCFANVSFLSTHAKKRHPRVGMPFFGMNVWIRTGRRPAGRKKPAGGRFFSPRVEFPDGSPKRRTRLCRVLLFGFRCPEGSSTLRYFNCSGQVNCPYAKVLAFGQNACAAQTRRPTGQGTDTSLCAKEVVICCIL